MQTHINIDGLVFETERGFVLFQVRITFLNIIYMNFKLPWPAVTQAVCRRTLTVESRIRFKVSPCEICGRQSLPLSTSWNSLSVLSHQCSILIPFVILLSEGQAGEDRDSSNQCYAGYRTAMNKKKFTFSMKETVGYTNCSWQYLVLTHVLHVRLSKPSSGTNFKEN